MRSIPSVRVIHIVVTGNFKLKERVLNCVDSREYVGKRGERDNIAKLPRQGIGLHEERAWPGAALIER